ncbi:uncharacterized protein LOC125428036 [Sphaerodactylus townsendi]|uniref:uncharacterized protein LOC125428036 n=1 Tax=Sphaerodactylus townsendi TaxID=933632 RepID=UPI0020268FDE|nr:uncharacterized protein LOC125428036 [Sphaerodactylus townsendi]
MRRTSSWVLELSLSLSLFICGRAFQQPLPIQPPRASFAEGTTAVLQCRLERGHIQDYHVSWFRQTPGDPPAHLASIITRTGERNASGAAARDSCPSGTRVPMPYELQIQGQLDVEDKCCPLGFPKSTKLRDLSVVLKPGEPHPGIGRLGPCLSRIPPAMFSSPPYIMRRNPLQEPVRSRSLFDRCRPDKCDSSRISNAFSLAEGRFQAFRRIKWSLAGKATITEGVTPGQVILNNSSSSNASYSTTSLLTIPRVLLCDRASLKCWVHHYSSGSKAERSLELC